jgi:hypothetical protein
MVRARYPTSQTQRSSRAVVVLVALVLVLGVFVGTVDAKKDKKPAPNVKDLPYIGYVLSFCLSICLHWFQHTAYY